MRYNDPLFTTTLGFGVSSKVSVKATGYYTIIDFNNLVGNVETVNGVALREGIEWTTSTSNSVTATNLAAAITTATATTLCTAVGVGALVNITANAAGTAGNSITIALSDGSGISKSGATLTGGA